ncbi:MerR family transcriptional regulator [Paenibacillus tepidiphilus]|uniref:MerR family transcriptional regulator n=1 Tax=Paenibacillus tepidiphilus TaxID=2608683 RepID=UPI00123ACD0E|nr:MerR family transcriptional regulator [Paenibacillus tepidiphilus]
MQIQKQYFTTSELAKTCGVTKHTLFHYDDIGLLKPAYVNSKGYRYYSLQQCYTLDIINVLKKAGSSLQEIIDFFANQNKVEFVNLIQQKQRELEMEQVRIKRMQSFLAGAVEMTETVTEDLWSTPVLEKCDAEYYVATALEPGADDHEYAKKLSRHRTYCEENLIVHAFPVCTIMRKENFEAEVYFPNYIANKLPAAAAGEHVFERPEGLYAMMDHRGSYESMPVSYGQMKNFIRTNGMRVSGNVYEVERVNYLTEKNPDNYVIRISVEVAPE